MNHRKRKPPTLSKLIGRVARFARGKPVAFVLAGHNGSGKSTLWNDKLAPTVQIPLINADRLLLSVLPEPRMSENSRVFEPWAQELRDHNFGWQQVGQSAVQEFVRLATERKLHFAFETVFSHWKENPDGTIESKIDLIRDFQKAGYYVVLLFVGLASVELSEMRVLNRKRLGGHDVPQDKLIERFPRTQKAIGMAAPVADMTIMFDNSQKRSRSFILARAQAGSRLLFDCRDPKYSIGDYFRISAATWLDVVVPNIL